MRNKLSGCNLKNVYDSLLSGPHLRSVVWNEKERGGKMRETEADRRTVEMCVCEKEREWEQRGHHHHSTRVFPVEGV